MKLLFIDNYDSFTYNLVELLRKLPAVSFDIVKNDQLHTIVIEQYDKVLISPGPDIPKQAGGLRSFIDQYITELPFLGICLGHQAIAQHFGAKLVQYENPLHGEKTKLQITDHSQLFQALPQSIEVGLYHSWYVSDENWPNELSISARNTAGTIMAFQHTTLPVYGVQFHPESFMSEYGMEILQNFVQNG